MSFRRHLLVVAGLFLAGVLGIVLSGILDWPPASTFGLNLCLLAILWLLFIVVRAIARRLLWRVGRRLLLSYALIGVVPIPFVLGLAFIALYVLSGQLAARRVEAEIATGLAQLRAVAQALRQVPAEVEPTAIAGTVEPFLRGMPGVGWALRHGESPAFGGGDLPADRLLAEGRVHTSLEGIGWLDVDGEERHFLAVLDATGDDAVALAYWPLEPALRTYLEDRTLIAVTFPAELAGEAAKGRRKIRNGAFVFTFNGEEKAAGSPAEDSAPPAASDVEPTPNSEEDANPDTNPKPDVTAFAREPVPLGRGGLFAKSFVYWPRSIELPTIEWAAADWHAAIEGKGEPFPFLIRSSPAREYVELFHSSGADAMNTQLGRSTVAALLYLSIAIAAIYFLASLVAGLLVWRIAQATSRLHRGFVAIEKGDFHQRLRLRGRDQLSELMLSFNRMAEHLGHSVRERAEKESMERELRTARDLQRSLLPPSDFHAEGFAIAVDFQPAAAIGGDFYHLACWPDGRLIVVIADVSGHGLSTGIVMSAAKALLSALSSDLCPCPELFLRLDRELRALTGRRSFVTMALCAFDLAARRVELTNAGHVYPYRVTKEGELSQLANPSRPLGVGLPANFRSVPSPLAGGDLWVLLSDGFLEAMSPSGEVFGFERLESVIRGCAGATAEATRDTLVGAWRQFTGAECPEDDRTLIVLKVGDPVGALSQDVQSACDVG
jgi:serine phosphatase RsbU (regulator of sigma subunit)